MSETPILSELWTISARSGSQCLPVFEDQVYNLSGCATGSYDRMVGEANADPLPLDLSLKSSEFSNSLVVHLSPSQHVLIGQLCIQPIQPERTILEFVKDRPWFTGMVSLATAKGRDVPLDAAFALFDSDKRTVAVFGVSATVSAEQAGKRSLTGIIRHYRSAA